MTTAQRLIAESNTEFFAGAMKLENEIRELAVLCIAPNCYDRTWQFYDKSTIVKTANGYVVGK